MELLSHLPSVDAGWPDMLTLGIPPLEKVLRTVLVYLGIAVILRVAGKRLLTQMNSLDLVVVLLLSNVVQNAIIGNDNSLTGGLLGAVVLVAFNALLDRAAHRWSGLAWLLEGRPTTVVSHGVVDKKALRELGTTTYELDWALRHQGADEISDVARATITPGGNITVDLEPGDQPASRGELNDSIREILARLDRMEKRLPEAKQLS